MSKIASGLNSQASIVVGQNGGTSTGLDHQSNLASSCISQLTDSAKFDVNDLATGNTIFDDKRESLRSQVEKLTNTRRELKKLIKI